MHIAFCLGSRLHVAITLSLMFKMMFVSMRDACVMTSDPCVLQAAAS